MQAQHKGEYSFSFVAKFKSKEAFYNKSSTIRLRPRNEAKVSGETSTSNSV
jgi:hypothetical protein